MGWSKKYKRSIDCNNPKGFSQKAHCAGRKKRENVMSSKLEELVGKPITEEQFDEAAGKKDACYHKVKARYDVWPSAYASGALVKCRKVGAANWGKSKKEGLGDKIAKKLKKHKGVNLKKKKGGGHPPCGTSGKKRGYAKCVPASKAARMTDKQKASATRRKRAAQNKAGRGGKQSAGQGKKPIYVSTKPKK
jgi:hypothetical protein